MNSVHGAKASALLYSLVEMAKANDLRVCEYLEYLLDKLPKYVDDTKRDFLKIYFHGQRLSRKNIA